MRIFHRGGNAVDAGVAAMFAASVSEYSHFGFGGEAPILIRTAAGQVYSIAGVGTMPKLATADFFRHRAITEGELRMVEPGSPGDDGHTGRLVVVTPRHVTRSPLAAGSELLEAYAANPEVGSPAAIGSVGR